MTLNRLGTINRILNVSSTFKDSFMEAFYNDYTFAFKNRLLLNFDTYYLASFPAPVPALQYRHHLRSMRLEIPLETHYFTERILLD